MEQQFNKYIDRASSDRIDSSKGYVEGNVQWVVLGINYTKRNFKEEELFELLDIIALNYKSPIIGAFVIYRKVSICIKVYNVCFNYNSCCYYTLVMPNCEYTLSCHLQYPSLIQLHLINLLCNLLGLNLPNTHQSILLSYAT